MALGELVIKMSADVARFTSDMGKAVHIAQRSSAQITGALGSLGVGLSVVGIGAFLKHAIDVADKLNDLSKSSGVAGTTLGGLGFAAEQSGSNLEGVARAVGKLNLATAKAIGGNEEALTVFKNLGITLADLQKLSPDQVFAKIADAFSKAEDGAIKAAYGQALFGKAYQEIIPTLDEGGDKIRKNIAYYKQYSGVTQEIIEKSDAFNDQLVKLKLLTGALGTSIIAELLGPLTFLVDKLIELKETTGLLKSAMAGLGETLLDIASKLPLPLMAAAASTGLALKALAGLGRPGATPSGADAEDAGLGEAFRAAQRAKLNKLPALRDSGATSNAKAAADALRKLAELQSRLSLDALKESGQRETQLLDVLHQRNLVSEQDYWTRKLGIAKTAAEAETKVLKDLLAQQTAERDKLGKSAPKSKEHSEAIGKVFETQAKLNKITLDFGHLTETSYHQAEDAAIAYRRTIEDLDARILELSGDERTASLLRLALQQEELRAKANAPGFAGGAELRSRLDRERELTGLQLDFNAAREKQDLITSRLGISEERLQNSLRTGAISEIDALKRTGDARKAAAVALEGQVEAMERIAAANPFNEKFALQAEQARASLERLRSESELLAEKFDTIFKDSFADAFSDFVSGTKTAKEAFKSFSDAVVQQINRLAAQDIATQLSKSLGIGGGGGGGGGIGSFFAKMFGGGFGGGGGGFDANAGMFLGAFATGSEYVPRTGLAMVHKGEAIVPAGQNTGGGMAIVMNINTPDAGSFRASRNQIAGEMAGAIAASRRNK